MVTINRRSPAHQILDENMQRGLFNEIRAAYNMGNALPLVIMGDGDVVTRPNIAPRDDGVRAG